MILEKGNMWDVFGKDWSSLFLITTNPIRRKDGAVVMGRGIAKEAATRFPTLPYDFGTILNPDSYVNEVTIPDCGVIDYYEDTLIGYFMVKDHWRHPASLRIIESSLQELATVWQPHKEFNRIDLNFPGIGNGKLDREVVLPLLKKYLKSNRYHVWEYE